MRKSDTILGTLVGYSTSNFFRQAISALTLIIQPKLLSPELFGLWNLLKVIPAYAAHVHLGAKDSARYLIPYNQVQHDHAKIAAIKGTVRIGSLILNLIIALGVLPLMFYPGISMPERIGVITAVGVTLLTWRFQYLLMLLKAEQQFSLIMKVNYIKSITAFATSIALILLFGIYGVFVSAIITLIVSLIVLENGYHYGEHGTFSLRLYWRLVRIGFPILLFYLSSVMLITSGRILISWKLGHEQLGYYSLSALVLGGLLQIPGAAREIIEPRLMQQTSEHSPFPYDRFFLKPLINTAFYMTFLITGVVIVFPFFCKLFLPRYTPGIIPVQIMVFGAYFMAMVYGFRGVVVAQHRQQGAAVVMSACLLLNVITGVMVLENQGGIVGMAVVTTLSCCILSLALLCFVLRGISHLTRRRKYVLLNLLIPFPAMLLLLSAGQKGATLLIPDSFGACAVELVFCWSGLFAMCRYFAGRTPLLDTFSVKQIFRSLKA